MDQFARTVLALVILIFVAGLVPLVARVRQACAAASSATRCAVELMTVGLLLGAVFRAPLAMLSVLAVMLVALRGITIGGAMTASTLAGRRFLAELRGHRAESRASWP
jgi:hypothetical protein